MIIANTFLVGGLLFLIAGGMSRDRVNIGLLFVGTLDLALALIIYVAVELGA